MTIADVADAACVGKGTIYLHWRSKQELVLDVLAQEFRALVDACGSQLESDPRRAHPSQLCARLVRAATRSALLQCAQDADRNVLGELADDARTASLVANLSPRALVRKLMPAWRLHGVADVNWTEDYQNVALSALLEGLIRLTSPPRNDIERVTAVSVSALLEPVGGADNPDIVALAGDVAALLHDAKASCGMAPEG